MFCFGDKELALKQGCRSAEHKTLATSVEGEGEEAKWRAV